MKTAAIMVVIGAFLLAGYAAAQDEPAEKPAAQQDDLDAKIAKLVKDLSSDDFKEREAATKELTEIGEPAAPALKEAMKSDDAEVKWRAETILKEIEKPRLPRQRREEPLREGERPARPGLTLPGDIKELLKDLPEEQRKMLEEMLKSLEKLGEGPLPPDAPVPPPDWDGDMGDLEEMARKMTEEMRKEFQDARKRFEEMRKRMRENDSGPREEPQEGPRTEPGDEENGKPRRQAQPGARSNANGAIVIRKLTWKDGRLVDEEEYEYDSELPGIFVTDRGDVLDALRYHLSLGEDEGVLVQSIEKDSPFEKAGVLKHDIITKVDDQKVDSRDTLMKLLKDKDKVTLEVVRRGERETIEVELKKK
jgi:hypothetical protein